jgi:predicted DNA-binding transcriptional regulator AlpA
MKERRDQAVTEHDVAERLGLSVATLRAWRRQGRGPRYMRFGRAVRYLVSDIERFQDASAVETQGATRPSLERGPDAS